MVCRDHGSGHAAEQFSVPLLACHKQYLVQWKIPVQGQMPDRFTAGCQARKNVQIPVATQKRLSLQSCATQPLTHQIKQGFIWLAQQKAHLPGALMWRVLKGELILQIRQ